MAANKSLDGEIDNWLKQEDVKWKQRAKKEWYRRRNKNTKIFHTCGSQRQSDKKKKSKASKNQYVSIST